VFRVKFLMFRALSLPPSSEVGVLSDRSTDRPTSQPTNQSTNQTTNQPTNKPTNQPTNQPNNQPTNQPTNQSINQPTKPFLRMKRIAGVGKQSLRNSYRGFCYAVTPLSVSFLHKAGSPVAFFDGPIQQWSPDFLITHPYINKISITHPSIYVCL
jgi:hypothetical protein